MAVGDELQRPNKRKRDASAASSAGKAKEKPQGGEKKRGKPAKPSAQWRKPKPPAAAEAGGEDQQKKKHPETARERRLAAKEMAESRKKKRKPNYSLEKELTLLWEKMRCHNVSKEERSKLVSEAFRKMDGKFLEIAGSHVTARVLQTCVKWCSRSERDAIFDCLKPHLLTLSRQKYAVFLVKKLILLATKKQFDWFLSSLHGQVAALLRHTVGAAVVECAFQRAMGRQKRSLLMELYSTELQLFKDLTVQNSGSLVDTISKLGLQKLSVLQHMTCVIQPLLEKGIVEYSIVHTAILEYFTIADKTSAEDVIRQLLPLLTQGSSVTDEDEPTVASDLPKKTKAKKKRMSEPLLVRIMHTREGLKIGISCLKYGSAKDRKKIVKSLKGHIRKLALDDYGCLFLVCILSVVDDTKLVTKIIIQELGKHLKELVLDKNGRRPLLQLLHPLWSRFLTPEDLACLNYSVPSLNPQSEASEFPSEVSSENKVEASTDKENIGVRGTQLASESKKDPSQRRYELLIKSELAESLVETCIENAGSLLRSNFGKDILYEVAVGGKDNILQCVTDKVYSLHNAIASNAALPKTDDNEIEHAFEHYHSSRVIRRLILECPAFAATLWKIALEGKCELWAQGHSSKVIGAFLESADPAVRDLAKSELQPLVDRGILKIPEHKLADK